jgi:hypothetical protein
MAQVWFYDSEEWYTEPAGSNQTLILVEPPGVFSLFHLSLLRLQELDDSKAFFIA